MRLGAEGCLSPPARRILEGKGGLGVVQGGLEPLVGSEPAA